MPEVSKTGFDRQPAEGNLDRGFRAQETLALLLLFLVVVSLLSLSVYTTVVQRKTHAVLSTANALLSPGFDETQELIVAMSTERAVALRSTDAEERSASRAERRRAMDGLARVAGEVGGDATVQYDTLALSMRRWEDALYAGTTLGAAGSEPALAAVLDSLYRKAILDALSLQRAFYSDIERAHGEIDVAEKRDWYYTLGVGLMALTASVAVTWLVRRIRELALVSERRRTEAETANANRTRLIRGITHDVKNPLGAADGNAELLEMGILGELTSRQLEAIARIRRNIGGALGIVSDLVEFSRVEAQELSLEVTPTDIGRLVDAISEDYRSHVEANGITLTVDRPADPPVLMTDARRVRQIIGNLLSNAIKFTPAGGRIAVGIETGAASEAPQAAESIAISVADTGAGIPPEEQERVFEEFYRSPGSLAAGSGIGLAISRRLARMLGGDLVLSSRLGSGSVFRLILPIAGPGSGRRA